MTLRDLADNLMEIRRYVRSDPEYVHKQINVLGASECIGVSDGDLRLYKNIRVGVRFIRTDPEVLECYLYAAAFEIRNEAMKQEREA